MSNGFTVEQMLDRIEEHVLRVEGKVDKINTTGCALKPEHDRRLKSLESSRARGTAGILAALASSLTALGAALWRHIAAGG